MTDSPTTKELLLLLNEFEVEYLIVGGFAVMKYGEPRYTKDLDVWVHSSVKLHPAYWPNGSVHLPCLKQRKRLCDGPSRRTQCTYGLRDRCTRIGLWIPPSHP